MSETARISLSKALKLKNRLAGRLSQVTGDIQRYNSVLGTSTKQVDVPALLEQRRQLITSIVELKLALYKANSPIQKQLYVLAEKKGEIDFYRSINTRDGSEQNEYSEKESVWSATLKKSDVDRSVRELESQIDAIQEELDEYNYGTKIEVPQLVLDLASS